MASVDTGPDAVLVVDDDPGMRETLVAILMENGILAESAGSGAAAMARAPGLNAAAVLVDQRLPDILGIDLCARLKAADKDLQAILLTGYATLETAIAAVGHVDEFLTKPVPAEHLVQVVRAALARRRLRRENASLVEQLRQANFDLAESVGQRNRDLRALSAMAEALSGVVDLYQVIEIVAASAMEASGAAAVAVYLAEDSGTKLRLAGYEGLDDFPAQLSDRHTAEAELSTRRPVQLAPLEVAGLTVGLLVLSDAAPSRQELVDTVAAQAALAVQNSQRLARERETIERLEELARLKSAFLASVSHELRTPLAAVVGFAEVLKTRWSDINQPDREHILTRMVAQGERLRRLIENLLDSTSLEMGNMRIRTEAVDVSEVLRQVVASRIGTESLHLELSEDLPPVSADAARLAQVVANLLDNAVRHGGDNGSAVTVSAFRSGADNVEVSVADQGPGIAPAFLPRVFEAFTQAEDPDHNPGGVGLGLHVTRGIVEAMGGEIGVDSHLGVGSTFWVRLPVQSSPGSQEQ
jgi:K+-sensing histidine kinase KdpD/CheY-like chemotaxis protein